MDTPSLEIREYFHMVLLRHLGARLSGRSYAVKGGICLRFFHRSPRFSLDMDLDVASNVRVSTLRNAVDSVLESRAFLASLAPKGIARLQVSRPKQTETTQRWKVSLISSGGGIPLPTKVEFSRRRGGVAYSTGLPDGEMLTRHGMPPFAAQYYGATDMAAQKVLALASDSRYAVRDLFDLHHLSKVVGVRLSDAAGSLRSGDVEQAAEKCGRFTFGDFREQVLPYLSASLLDAFKNSEAFERLESEVRQALLGALR